MREIYTVIEAFFMQIESLELLEECKDLVLTSNLCDYLLLLNMYLHLDI